VAVVVLKVRQQNGRQNVPIQPLLAALAAPCTAKAIYRKAAKTLKVSIEIKD
jgi:hypothetical protein